MTALINLQTGQPEEVDDPLAALRGGTHGLDPSAQVPIKDQWGNVKVVPAKDVEAAVSQPGAGIASAEEARQADLEAKHGGLLGQAAAGAEGLARGVTVGISDPLAIEAARVWGGDHAAEAVRTHLAEEQEAHPTISKVGEVAGAIAPILATGGEAAVEEAPELLKAGESLASAAKPSLIGTVARYTPAGITGRLGAAAERATAEVLGSPAASSALGRIAKAAARSAISGGVENAIFEAGGQLSEDALGDHEATGQKFLAALGHGFVWGAILGGGMGGATHAASEAAAPLLRRVAPHLEGKADELAWNALGGTERAAKEADEVGGVKAVGETVTEKTGLHEGPLHAAVKTPADMAPRIDEAIAKSRETIDNILQTHGAKPGEVQIPGLDGIRALRKDGMDAIDLQAKKFAVPEAVRATLKKEAQDYERLLIAKKVNAEAVADAVGKAKAPPVAPGAMYAAGHALIAGHPVAAASIVAASAGRQALRNFMQEGGGKMLAVVTMKKIARMDLLARAVNAVDQDLEHAAGTIVGKKGAPRPSRFSGPSRDASAAKKWEHAHAQDDKVMATPQHWEQAFPGLKTQAPKVTHAALRALNAGAMYLTMAKPPRLDKPTLAEPTPTPRVSSVAAEEQHERVRAVQDPVGTLADGIEDGTLSKLQVDAVAATSPRVLDTLKQKIVEQLSEPHKPLSDAKIRVLQTLFQGAGDELSSPEMGAMIHAAYQDQPAPAPAAVTPGAVPASRPVKGFAQGTKTKLERVQDTGS